MDAILYYYYQTNSNNELEKNENIIIKSDLKKFCVLNLVKIYI